MIGKFSKNIWILPEKCKKNIISYLIPEKCFPKRGCIKMSYKSNKSYKTDWIEYEVSWNKSDSFLLYMLNLLILQFFFIRLYRVKIIAYNESTEKEIEKGILKLDGFIIPMTGFFSDGIYIKHIPLVIRYINEKEWK